MANRIRTIDFLPEIFRTETNKQFLSSTLDQLVQEPKLKPTQGYIGRKVGPGVDPTDNYIIEPTAERTNYQLEPGVIFLKENTNTVEDALTYPGFIDILNVNGANTTRYDRMFNSEYYSWDPFVDFDKFVNFGQYYWLPAGPDSVDVSASTVNLTDDFTVSRGTQGYSFSGVAGTLPTLTLVRGGNYTFDVNQTGTPFYIQSEPGTSGTVSHSNNISSRDVLGVANNGEDLGTVTFNVPDKDAQNFYFTLADEGTVDLVTNLKLDQINGISYSDFIAEHDGIDSIHDLDQRTIIFLNEIPGIDGGWTLDGSTEITDDATKYAVWRINLSSGDTPYITLSVVKEISNLSKLKVNYGSDYAGLSFYKNASGYYEQIPLITANLDTLYYQDATNGNFIGVIKLVDQTGNQTLDIDDILSRSTYISPNGVTFTNGLKVQFRGDTNPASYSNNSYYVEGVGSGIKLLPVTDFITPESYTRSSSTPFDSTGYDVGAYDDTLNAPLDTDYMTINRASGDKNPWTRSNRWFHIDVINATAEYNNTVPVLDNNYRAKRPILEFRDGLKLFNFGTEAIAPVDIIDFAQVDAFSNINGTIGYSVDGYSFNEGTRVIFAADNDNAVRNKVYVVKFVRLDDSSEEVIDLQPADILTPGISSDQTVVVTSGITSQGNSYYYDGSDWQLGQQKTATNQAPLFDLYDVNGVSFGDQLIYPSSDFEGSKLFSYAVGTGTTDSVIGQPLKYLSINNVGDIVFDNNINTDTFVYVADSVSVTANVDSGIVRQYSTRTTYSNLIGWQTSFTQQTSRQSFEFTYSGSSLKLDVAVDETVDIPVKVFVNGTFVLPNTYTYTTNSEGLTEITFVSASAPATNSKIEVSVISKTPSNVGYYEVATNLENNAINETTDNLTLGTIRNHYNSICQNLQDFSGVINGANNLRDLGNTIPYGQTILQHSAPMTMAGVFLQNQDFAFFDAITWCGNEYEKFKNVMLDNVANNDWSGYTAYDILDNVLDSINLGKNELSPFYWSDTLPSGNTFEETVYTYTAISTNVFDTLYSYDFTQANYSGLLVYLNDVILNGDEHDYTVAEDGPRITINTDKITLTIGDKIRIREYQATYGSYVPPTPTKLGLFKAYEPEKFTDDTYITPTDVIRGHDGSLTVAFNDVRDDVLLEFEKRIYSNIKVPSRYSPPIDLEDITPGQFRTTDYSLSEVTEILSLDFLSWVGANKLDYKNQIYDANNKFTWNYSTSQNKLDGSLLQGNWRAIYQYLYDTDSPHERPWEMLGLTEIPDWWTTQYGPAPYTSGNLVLWEDLRDGKINNPAGATINSKFVRPNLLDIIPVDSEGNLLAPIDVIVGNYDQNSFQKSWTAGDQGATETAWRRSSSFRFSAQRLMAVTQPAKYFALFADRDRYKLDTSLNQIVYDNRFRLDPKTLVIYGNGTAKHSYINYVVDYNRILGLDSTQLVKTRLENIDVRLCYRMASFSDKNYLKIFTEKSSPNSLNSSLLLPDESYQLLLYKNPVFDQINYSSVIVQKTTNGYSVYGYGISKPYFEIYRSIPNGNFTTLTIAGTSARIAKDFTSNIVRVPYGYEFTSESSVVDFIVSYGKRLEDLGMSFDSIENNIILNWSQMAEEFLYWSQQGWSVGGIINLNPTADNLSITKENAVVDSIIQTTAQPVLMNQNKKPLLPGDYVTTRLDNTFSLKALTNNNFNYLNAKFTSYEHIIIFDNTSIFNDLLYDPGTGARQGRVLLNGYNTYEWNGTLDAQGFILNQDNVQEWSANNAYSKGEIVLYKGSYWSAGELIPPESTFDFNKWIKSDYEKITKGLLPNLATKADLIRNFYDTKTANLENDADLLSFGLIGFRQRQYMQNLNLDDISQVNLYKQFLGTKGTTQATDIFSSANLNKEVAEYEIFENWAINRATYGANANRSYFEIKLNEAELLSNPSTVSVVNPQETNTSNQKVLLNNLYKESYKIPSTNILPTINLNQPDIALPSAGYVNYDDVDIKVFDYNDLSVLVANIDEVAVGSIVWVAKSNNHDWNVFRLNLVEPAVIQVKDNLDGTCTVTFASNHNLSVDQKIVIKYFDSIVDGSYDVVSVPGLKTVTIFLSLPGNTTTLTGLGLSFVLESVRVAQASDIAGLSYADTFITNDQVWVDDDGTGHWAVYKKNNPFDSTDQLLSEEVVLNNQFGYALAQGLLNQGAIVGAPGYDSSKGAVYAYNKASNIDYIQKVILSPDADDISGFGKSIAVGDNSWGVIGASDSASARGYVYTVNRNSDNGQYILKQLLVESTTSASSEFGYSVEISKDERWMYVSAPGDDTVYAYNKVPVQNQILNFTGNGSTKIFTTSGTIVVDDDSAEAGIGSQQISVTVNNIPKVANVDWYYSGTAVIFFDAPNTGDEIIIRRKQSLSFFPSSPQITFSIEDLYTAQDYYSFSVIVNSVLQRPYLDYTFDPATKIVTFINPGVGVSGTVVISSNTYWKLVDTITFAGIDSTGIDFGYSLTTTTDGRQLTIGVPDASAGDEIDGSGQVYLYDRSVERFQLTDATTRIFTTLRNPTGPVTVKLNNEFLLPSGLPSGSNNNGQFTVSGNVITLESDVTIAVGDLLEIETNEFKLMQTIESNNIQEFARFGEAVDQCPTNCSLYIGMPNDNSQAVQGGAVERWINQNRLFGIITSKNANAVLSPGNTIRINNYDVTVSTPTTWSSSLTFTSGTYVINEGSIYVAIQDVPASIDISNTTYWALSNWIQLYTNDINTADIPNVTATESNGLLTLSLVDITAADEFIKLIVLPGNGGAWTALGFEPMAYAQTILPPVAVEYGHFGSAVNIDSEADNLVVGAPDSTATLPTIFDSSNTIFDSGATNIADPLDRSGVVYTYDFLSSASSSVSNPGKFVFGQQIFDQTLASYDTFGQAVNYVNGVLLIGAPGDDLGDSTGNYGRVSQHNNSTMTLSWTAAYVQQPVVDAQLINSVFTYDRISNSVTSYLDFIDPLQGKILGSAKQNIDYIVGIDPAPYNTGSVNNYGQLWTDDHLGEIWWDTSTVRFIDYHQDTIDYKAKRWGQVFPGSSIDVYQWIESDVPPANYTGPGTVFSTTSYTVGSELNLNGIFDTKYYYWVKDIPSVASQNNKTLSVQAIAQYIENPRSSGIAYIAPIATNTVALYNCRDLIGAQDTILHVEFDRVKNNDNVHVEYDLVAENNAESFLGDGLYRKMLDSFCGEDTLGNIVPDSGLSIADKYGVNFRPRQSFFVDRFLALENYIGRANTLLARYPIAEIKPFDLLNSEELEPTSATGEWNTRVATYAELTYQNLLTVAAGYKYLVASDENNSGLWTIYTVQADKSLLLTRVQNYDTKQFWEYADWIKSGYNIANRIIQEVATFSDLAFVTTAIEGDSVKVTSNSFGKSEIYQYTNGEWIRVFAENTTIQIKSDVYDYSTGRYGFDIEVFDAQRFDQNPVLETRQILKALNQEIFTEELLIHRNELLILVFGYILTEQTSPDWLFKTSLVDVNHKIRDLVPFDIYRRDNQDFVLDYIKEVKPYHVKIKEFSLRYDGIDNYLGTLTDFDVPAYYDSTYGKFISPVLDETDYETVTTALESHVPSTNPIWQTLPWSQWYDNYKLSLESVTISSAGSGYTVAPQVTITGGNPTVAAELTAKINSAGEVAEIEIVSTGSGYTGEPTITISGGNGSGAVAHAVLGNNMVRSIATTLKFDRYEYTSSVQDWQANTFYEEGSYVRFNNTVYSVNNVADSSALDSGASFDPDYYTVVDQSTLSGVDRVIGLYSPDVTDPGRELALVIAGIDYPGVQVQGPLFNQNTGFDVGNFDINSFDNISFGPEGLPTYSEDILDATYESSFTDTYLGTRTTDINVEGGGLIDTYSSHAPEELVPGSNFDTLDMRVYTRPGADWTGDGHGFALTDQYATFTSGGITVDWSAQQQHPVAITVENITLGRNLSPIVPEFSVDWIAKTATITSGASVGDELRIRAIGVGGGDQIFKETFNGAQVGNSITIDVDYDMIYEFFIVVNGIQTTDFTFEEGSNSWQTTINFGSTYTASQSVTIAAFCTTTPGGQRTWSTPRGEYFIYSASTTFSLSTSLQGTNPINLIVYRDGFRLRPAESVEYTGDGSSAGPYYLPSTGGTNQGTISDNEVKVYVDNEEQFLAVDWTLSTWDGSSDRYIAFNTAPDINSKIIIAVTTNAGYSLNGSDLTLKNTPVPGAEINVVTWNDTSEQDILTLVFQGPTEVGSQVQVAYDSVGYDSDDFDESVGVVTQENDFDLGRTITDDRRLEVTLNGNRLVPGENFTTSGTILTVGGSILGPSDVLVVTIFTMNVTPETLNFRIFQDMFGVQKILRLNQYTTTTLTQNLSVSDDTIYVSDASLLAEPDIPANILGAVIINGERITYRLRDVTNNTISGLRRGVAGTAIQAHASGSTITDAGIGEQIPSQYQQTTSQNSFTGDGTTTRFIANSLSLASNLDSTEIEQAVKVTVGGTVLTASEYLVSQINPVEVTLVDAPADGVSIIVSMVKGRVMYAQGTSTASNGIALQEQTTDAVDFLRGGQTG